jgi:hypothetical protein
MPRGASHLCAHLGVTESRGPPSPARPGIRHLVAADSLTLFLSCPRRVACPMDVGRWPIGINLFPHPLGTYSMCTTETRHGVPVCSIALRGLPGKKQMVIILVGIHVSSPQDEPLHATRPRPVSLHCHCPDHYGGATVGLQNCAVVFGHVI